jgi:mono/diheme cytochrome c family protein
MKRGEATMHHAIRRTILALLVFVILFSGWAAGAQDRPLSPAARREAFIRGAQVWPVACASCHKARPGSEFSPDQWKLIMRHMQIRAQLPARDIQAVLIYLQSAHQPPQ